MRLSVALPAYLVLTAISLLVYWSIMRAMHRPITTGPEGMIGARAEAVTNLSPTGRVRYQGELLTNVSNCDVKIGLNVKSATCVAVEHARLSLHRCV